MNDLELTALAAKAGGFTGQFSPLTDDGDALRLKVKLGLNIYAANDDYSRVGACLGGLLHYAEEEIGTDAAAATRRAIVRAAAAIGAKA